MQSLCSDNNAEIIDANEAAKRLNECSTSFDINKAILINNKFVGKNIDK